MLSVTLAILVWGKLIDKRLARELSKTLGMKSIHNMTFDEILYEIEETASLIEGNVK